LRDLEFFWDYRKMNRLPLFKHCLEFFQDIHDGKITEHTTDADLKKHPYLLYLLRGRSPESKCLVNMRDGIRLYNNIKDFGMREPLEAWRDEKRGKLNIHRGLRRLAVLKALGRRNIPIRVFRDRRTLELMQGDPHGDTVPDDSIHGLAVKQFAKESFRGTDKFWIHNYTPIYDKYLSDKRDKYKKILEIGVSHGGSLLLWHDVFPKAHIYGVDKDISRARLVKGLDRVTLLKGVQGDKDFFRNEVVQYGLFDLIVDDCSHNPKHQKETLEILWNSVNDGGYYVIEDLFWRGTEDKTAQKKLFEMVDSINALEVESVSFYYNLCLIKRR